MLPMRSSRTHPRKALLALSAAGISALLLAGCGWSPGGPALETPTAIAPLVLQPPATRSAELLTLVAMMPPTATDTPAPTPSGAPMPLPSPTASPAPLPAAATPAPEEATAIPEVAPTDTPTDVPTVEPAETATLIAAETATATLTATMATEAASEATAEATTAEVATATAESTPATVIAANPEISATSEITPDEAITTPVVRDIVAAVRATTITLPLAGAVTAFPMVDGRHAPSERKAEASDARVRLLSPVVQGDLTGDGVEEVVALAEIGVGDRSLVYLLAFAHKGTADTPALAQIARVLVGADVRVGALVIDNQIVRLEVVQWQGKSPLCCAVRRQQFGYRLEDEMLAMVESDDIAIAGGTVAVNEVALMPQAVATAQAREPGLQRDATVAGEAEVGAINLYTLSVAAGDTLVISTESEALPVRLVVTSADEPVLWRDGSAALPLEITLPATQTLWIGVQGVEMATPYTLTVTLAPPAASR